MTQPTLLRAGGTVTRPVLKLSREFIVAQRRGSAPLTGIPTPQHKFVGSNVLDDLRNCLTVILFGILDLATDLSRRASFPNHRHGRGRQMPVGSAGRHVQSGNVLFLMTGSAFLAVLAFAIDPAAHVSPRASIGACVAIGPRCEVGDGALIEAGCVLGAGVRVPVRADPSDRSARGQ